MKTKHIETESAIVNIRSDLEDPEGRSMEVIEIMPTKHEGWEIEHPTRNSGYSIILIELVKKPIKKTATRKKR